MEMRQRGQMRDGRVPFDNEGSSVDIHSGVQYRAANRESKMSAPEEESKTVQLDKTDNQLVQDSVLKVNKADEYLTTSKMIGIEDADEQVREVTPSGLEGEAS
mmetsp:Transcript_16769/g.25840  ORF Transcript_16769/g.25840 Transcript_16769/m.25840 type:complete len:103 (+) Transcript_16769:1395-1703(+)